MINKCIVCGKEFEAIKSTKKYCSKECTYKMRRIRWHENHIPVPREQRKNNCPKKKCLICGKIFQPKTAAANQRSCCYDCMPDGKQLTRGGFLSRVKEVLGGTCRRCGYNTCVQVLDFHHIDSSEKEFTISNDSLKLKDAMIEIRKCVLLCSNCHRELHAHCWDLSELSEEDINHIKLTLGEYIDYDSETDIMQNTKQND